MTTWKAGAWIPVRNGEFYCSPACGGGKLCKWAWFEAATQNGAKLAADLGPGWTARVWENLGWHYCVTSPCQRITVHVHALHGEPPRSYTAYLGEPGGPGGRWTASASNPHNAVREVLKTARADLALIGAVFTDLSYFEEKP